jgi:nucleoside 2-deoxyribosyltransferase
MAIECYIAGCNIDECKALRDLLVEKGYEITAKWLDEPFRRTLTYSVENRRHIANMDRDDVLRSDLLIHLATDRYIPGGKFVEVGIAIGANIPVINVGHQENMLMWCDSVETVDTQEEAILLLERRILGL